MCFVLNAEFFRDRSPKSNFKRFVIYALHQKHIASSSSGFGYGNAFSRSLLSKLAEIRTFCFLWLLGLKLETVRLFAVAAGFVTLVIKTRNPIIGKNDFLNLVLNSLN